MTSTDNSSLSQGVSNSGNYEPSSYVTSRKRRPSLQTSSSNFNTSKKVKKHFSGDGNEISSKTHAIDSRGRPSISDDDALYFSLRLIQESKMDAHQDQPPFHQGQPPLQPIPTDDIFSQIAGRVKQIQPNIDVGLFKLDSPDSRIANAVTQGGNHGVDSTDLLQYAQALSSSQGAQYPRGGLGAFSSLRETAGSDSLLLPGISRTPRLAYSPTLDSFYPSAIIQNKNDNFSATALYENAIRNKLIRDNAILKQEVSRNVMLQQEHQGVSSASTMLRRAAGMTAMTASLNLVSARSLNPLTTTTLDDSLRIRQQLSRADSDSIPTCLPVSLAIPEDNMKLSSHQVLLRHQIEAFKATEDDVSTHTRGRNKPVLLGQIGIRCRYCSHLPVIRREKGSTYFPSSLKGLYQAAQNMSTTHMQTGVCNGMPSKIKHQMMNDTSSKTTSSGAGRKYWADSALKLGLVDTEEGIRFVRDLL